MPNGGPISRPGYVVIATVPKNVVATVNIARNILRQHRAHLAVRQVRETRKSWVALFHVRILYRNGTAIQFEDYGDVSEEWRDLLLLCKEIKGVKFAEAVNVHYGQFVKEWLDDESPVAICEIRCLVYCNLSLTDARFPTDGSFIKASGGSEGCNFYRGRF
mmetsp:Transcript_63780/g.132826  ORF Transcript_63780/g.132826 Transcript_63780/m.132826 type:complete len:161 (+) Transcript_63780:1034-1516(+)